MKTIFNKKSSIFELMTVSSLTKNPCFYLLLLKKSKSGDKVCLTNVDSCLSKEVQCVSRRITLPSSTNCGEKAQIVNGNPSTGFNIVIVERFEKKARLGIWNLTKN